MPCCSSWLPIPASPSPTWRSGATISAAVAVLAKRGRVWSCWNKIDGQWDELKTAEEIDAEIQRQVETSADVLELPASQVSRCRPRRPGRQDQRRCDTARTQPPAATRSAMSEELIPAKRDIVCDSTERIRRHQSARARPARIPPDRPARAADRTDRTARQEQGRRRIHDGQGARRKDEFESGLQRYYAVRSVFSTLTNNLFGHLGLDVLRQLTQKPDGDDARRLLQDLVRCNGQLLRPFARSAEQVEWRDR